MHPPGSEQAAAGIERRTRISTKQLLAVIAAIGLAIGSLRSPHSLWAGTWLISAAGILGYATLGTIYRRGSARASCVGFAIFGWIYMLVTLLSPVFGGISDDLVTSKMIDHAYKVYGPTLDLGAWEGRELARAEDFVRDGNVEFASRSADRAFSIRDKMTPEQRGQLIGLRPFMSLENRQILDHEGLANVRFPLIRQSVQDTRQIGHCVFTLLAALIGAALARRLQRQG